MYLNSALLIAGAVVVGYVFAARLLWLRYRLRLTQGYHTFLFTAASSVVPLALAGFVVSRPGIECRLGHLVVRLLGPASLHFSPQAISILVLMLVALFLAATVPVLVHHLARLLLGKSMKQLKLNAMYLAEPAPTLSGLQFSSYHYAIPMAVTLSDRKVYVGYPADISSSMYSAYGSEIHLIPLISGYRDPTTLDFIATTSYKTVMDKVAESPGRHVNARMFTISIPEREVVHAHLYDPELAPIFAEHTDRSESD
ncbi:hypothetical protein [Salinisphaera hydrothermalis]|uniref:Uncharacterized protein n=1 Tax=Salinisphaera hydrothermalis (strain C41B8) TaxID=1304275 RepID=A0A084IHL8_SALHC|nr:hypothetical protein [Salinisphaera hydrothermalis]KEZ76202.1 hypothetical protein C41B8_16074 [Salinisphaera hydrothermalis C41B8]